GHPWLIEINSKPSKNFEEQEIKIRPSAKAIISYCQFLALEHVIQKHSDFNCDSIKEDL
ncbi:MAG TPA: YheC/YheD family protein, partial [Pseudoneobacillus sp.]|nr:YheC/YheD family protein [Pseudoneobacillus sp.]